MGHHFQVASEGADQGGSGVPGTPHLSLCNPEVSLSALLEFWKVRECCIPLPSALQD